MVFHLTIVRKGPRSSASFVVKGHSVYGGIFRQRSHYQLGLCWTKESINLWKSHNVKSLCHFLNME